MENKYDGGFIKMHREILEWEWWGDHAVMIVFTYLLLKANWKSKRWRGNYIERGSLITSLNSISKDCKISKQKVRTALVKLEKTGEITRKITQFSTTVTICQYESYQGLEISSNTVNNTLPTHHQHSSNTLPTHTKEREEGKEGKEERGTPSFFLNQLQIQELQQQFPKINVDVEMQKCSAHIRANAVPVRDPFAYARKWLLNHIPKEKREKHKRTLG